MIDGDDENKHNFWNYAIDIVVRIGVNLDVPLIGSKFQKILPSPVLIISLECSNFIYVLRLLIIYVYIIKFYFAGIGKSHGKVILLF